MKLFKSKTLLVTGGTGSFGREFVKKAMKFNPKKIIIFSRDELKQFEMRQDKKFKDLDFFIGDIRDNDALDKVVKNVDYIFHAAALKQVPSCEFHPLEAIKTNIIGTYNLIGSAKKNSVRKIICLSTDKAVYPINTMGLSKSLMEKIALNESINNNNLLTKISVTRYGNVMGSRGSIIPHIIKQIKSNEPLTLTHKNMTRFLISMKQAIDLVFHALEKASNGDIFVCKAKSAKVINIIKALEKIYKIKNSKIKIIGIREGEKLHETLITKEEKMNCIDKKKYFILNQNIKNLDYKPYLESGKINKYYEDYSSSTSDYYNIDDLVKKISADHYIKL